MLTRRHIRVKVMQAVYYLNQNKHTSLGQIEKFLRHSMSQLQDLYVLQLQLFVELRKYAEVDKAKSRKRLTALPDINIASPNFANNKLLLLIESNEELSQIIENKKLNYWELDSEFVQLFYEELKATDWFLEYQTIENPSYKDDRNIVARILKDIVAPNDKLYQYLEDRELTWLDDFPIVNTSLLRVFSRLKPANFTSQLIPSLFRSEDDENFAFELLRRLVENDEDLSEEIQGKTPNWDQDRIAVLDMIILKMGITEFISFSSIPVRVTINEYLEVAKEYSTSRSSLFINGILDKLVKEYERDGKIHKIGRGLR